MVGNGPAVDASNERPLALAEGALLATTVKVGTQEGVKAIAAGTGIAIRQLADGVAEIATTAGASVAAHEADTTNVHGIADTSVLDTVSLRNTAIAAALLTLSVRHAAGVPTGAPATTELPIAFDSTAVSGGLYIWDGAAWVKAAAIP